MAMFRYLPDGVEYIKGPAFEFEFDRRVLTSIYNHYDSTRLCENYTAEDHMVEAYIRHCVEYNINYVDSWIWDALLVHYRKIVNPTREDRMVIDFMERMTDDVSDLYHKDELEPDYDDVPFETFYDCYDDAVKYIIDEYPDVYQTTGTSS